MNNIEGRIDIDMYTHQQNIDAVKIHSSRPVQASQIMIGKSPEQVLNMLPLMFSVCGVAQARTSLSAIMQQLNIQPTVAEDNARSMLVIAETLREHLLRIFMDWPDLFEFPRNNTAFPMINGLIKSLSRTLFKDGRAFSLDSEFQPDLTELEKHIDELENLLETHVFESPLKQWLSIFDLTGLTNWAGQCNSIAAHSINFILKNNWGDYGQCTCLTLPELDAGWLQQQFNQPQVQDFIAQPEWDNSQYETTTLTRQQQHPLIKNLMQKHGNALITQWTARLVELASIPEQLRSLMKNLNSEGQSKQQTNNTGIAQIEAARGRLIHHVEIEQENKIVSQYHILAPTEWNFHPKGLIQRSLSNIKSTDEDQIRSIAQLLINAIDSLCWIRIKDSYMSFYSNIPALTLVTLDA